MVYWMDSLSVHEAVANSQILQVDDRRTSHRIDGRVVVHLHWDLELELRRPWVEPSPMRG